MSPEEYQNTIPFPTFLDGLEEGFRFMDWAKDNGWTGYWSGGWELENSDDDNIPLTTRQLFEVYTKQLNGY